MKDYAHQARIVEQTRAERSWNIFGDTGTGKTRIALKTAEWMHCQGKIDGVMVLVPGGSYRNWTDIEIPKHMEIDYKTFQWRSSLTKLARSKLLSTLASWHVGYLPIFVMNIEALRDMRSDAYSIATQFLANHKVLLIVDESTSIRRPDAERTKCALTLARLAAAYRNLSGFPSPERATDLWTQCIALGRPDLFPWQSWYAFRNRFCLTEEEKIKQWRMVNNELKLVERAIVKVKGSQRQGELHELLLNFSTFISKRECLDLPPKVYQKRYVPMTKEQEKLYRQMQKQKCIWAPENADELTASDMASSSNALSQMEKLMQIAAGCVRDDRGIWHDIGSSADDELMEILEAENGKVVIWASYTLQIDRLVAKIATAYGAESVSAFYGQTQQNSRSAIVTTFQDVISPLRFLVGNPATGKFSWTLTAASTCIYMSNRHEVEPRHQSEDRLHRIGQTSDSVVYIDVIPTLANGQMCIADDVLNCVMEKRNAGAECLGPGWTKKLYGVCED